MKRILIGLIILMAISLSFAANTITAVTQSTVNTDFTLMKSTTTVADSTLLIYSNTFSGRITSGKVFVVTATVGTSFTATTGWAPTGIIPTVQISADGTNWVNYASYTVYQSSTKTAGTAITFPVSFNNVNVPYFRIRYTYYTGTTEYATADSAPRPLAGAITTNITVK